MALYMQYHQICRRVEHQLQVLRDEEKGESSPESDHRLSGHTANDGSRSLSPNEHEEEKPVPKDDQTAQYAKLPGISIKEKEEKDSTRQYLLVDWDSHDDPYNPRNWPTSKRLACTLIVSSIGFIVTAASSIDSATAMQAAEALGVSETAESLATALFLVGFGCGVLLSGPLSELLGRGLVYTSTLVLFMIWTMASALAPNFAGQIIFRFLAGFCGSAPLTVAGGSMSDMWNPKEKTWAFPIFGISGFGGPALGPVIGAWIGPSPYLSWRWSDWIMLIGTGVVFFFVVAFQPETMSPRLLKYKAAHLRKLTGDERFQAQHELDQGGLGQVLKTTLSRPFILITEPIVFLFGLYMSVVYIVLFTFLDGYEFIFTMTYGIGQGLTFTIFVGIFVGVLIGCVLIYPVLVVTNKDLKKRGDDGAGSKIRPELRLLYVMWGGAQAIPISLFWMGWTNYASISPWSGIIASVVFGYGIITVFLSAYMYIIDSYEVMSASALTIVTLMRYFAAGGMTVVGFPFYTNLGVHWTLTILGALSVLLVPVPYALYIWGPQIRKKSKYAIDR